jgi:protein-tyrosine-phosphatase/predicted ATP-grasp superfamily ATP-dependent carboligase
MPTPSDRAVLVLDADGRAGLACVQSLGRAGLTVHAAVRVRASATEHSRWCHRLHVQPSAEPAAGGAAWLTELDQRFGFDLVLPTTEASLRWLRRLPPTHPLRIKAVLPRDASLDAALDKEQTRELARSLGLPVPASRMLPQGQNPPPAEGTFPKVLKPVSSKVVIGTRLVTLAVAVVRDAVERDATLAAWLPFTAVQEQEWVPGHGVGVEVLYDQGRMAWHFAHERLHEWPLTGGASTWRRACGDESALVEKTRLLLDRLQWHGVAMVEWRRDEHGVLHLMEINPRLWGSLPLTIAAGVDMPLGLLALARGEPLAPAPAWRVGVTARNFTEDLQWFVENLHADRKNPLLLTQPVWRTGLGWLRLFTGRESWDGWSWRDPAVAFNEVRSLIGGRFRSLFRRVGRHAALARAKRHHSNTYGTTNGSGRPVSSVLFLCFGNICRSPFAALAARARLPGIRVDSAGFHISEGRPSPHHVVQTASSLGIDLSVCSSNRVTQERIAAADLILCMDLVNLGQLASEFPEALPRSTLLGLFRADGPAEIADPYDMPPVATRAVLVHILCAIDALADWLTVITPSV